MKREDLLRVYRHADVLFLHLNNLKAFRRVLPSKIFEYAATNKPIWGGLSGYAGRFAKNESRTLHYSALAIWREQSRPSTNCNFSTRLDSILFSNFHATTSRKKWPKIFYKSLQNTQHA